MKQRKHLALVLTLVLFIGILFGCGSKKSDDAATKTAYGSEARSSQSNAGFDMVAPQSTPNEAKADTGTVETTRKLPKDAKLIIRADLSLETTEFPKAQTAIETLVNKYGGYFEKSSVSSGSFYSENTIRSASYSIRVPKDNYKKFLNEIGNCCHLVDKSESAEDIGEVYFDTEIRLKTLKTKQERLLVLLSKAQKMEDIISLENALSDVQYQIDQYSSELKRYDNLVDFATVNASLQEVVKLSDINKNQQNFFPRLQKAIIGGFEIAGEAIQEFIIAVAYSMPVIIILAAVLLVVFIFRKKITIKRNKLLQHKQQNEDKDDKKDE